MQSLWFGFNRYARVKNGRILGDRGGLHREFGQLFEGFGSVYGESEILGGLAEIKKFDPQSFKREKIQRVGQNGTRIIHHLP